MATGDTFVALNMKRFLSQERMENDFFEYLQEGNFDTLSRIFPVDGLFTYPVSVTAAVGSFTINTDPVEGTDGEGHVVYVTGASYLQNIPFENTPGDIYWVGFKYNEIVSGVYTNPGTGQIEYDLNAEAVGELDEPSSVTDLTGTIQFNCNSIFEASVDHSGREVLVWLKNPVSADAAVAIETCTVAYDSGSGENRIVTSGTLGQGTVSTDVSDYQVACPGCTIRKGATDPLGDGYLMIVAITGHATTPTTNTTGVQLDLSGGGGHSLQAAYDGSSGSGSGRNILADYEAVEITQENDSPREHDIFNSSLRLRCDTDKSLYTGSLTAADMEIGLDVPTRFSSYGSLNHRVNIADFSGNNYILAEEDIQVAIAGNTITFTRVGVDLTLPTEDGALHPDTFWECCEISNSAQGNDGVYIVSTVTSSTLVLLDLDGNVPSLAAETAAGMKASLYRMSCRVGYGTTGLHLISTMDFQQDAGVSEPLLRMSIPSAANDAEQIMVIEKYNAAATTVTDYFRVSVGCDLAISGVITDPTQIELAAGSGVETGLNMSNRIIDDVAAMEFNASGSVAITTNNRGIAAGTGAIGCGSASVVNDITATSGDIEATSGDVTAGGGSVYAATSFAYTSAASLTKRLGAAALNPGDPGTENISYANEYWQLDIATASGLVGEIELPHGAKITNFDAKVYGVNYSGGKRINVYLYRDDLNLSVSSGAPSSSLMASLVNTGDGWETISTSSITNDTVSANYSYKVIVNMDDEVGIRFAGVNFSYELTTLEMQ